MPKASAATFPADGCNPGYRFQDPVNWRLPVLDAVIEAPTIRTDGTVLAQPGYDPRASSI
jgi:hypothetical protein